jgi:hypothetical protein
MARARLLGWVLATTLVTALAGCSGDGGDPGTNPGSGNPSCDAGEAFDGTFAAIQKVVFERNGCSQDICHGSAATSGLDLRPDAAYDSIFDVPALEVPSLKRVEPGDRSRSFLWLKLAAKTNPGSVQIVGAPMPNNLPAISANELEALRLWIAAGAPRTGAVAGTEGLLDACLPAVKPITIKPLDPPAPGEGVQFILPPVDLPKKHEQELCFATYYDIRDQVPAQFLDPTGTLFRFSAQQLRQDPQSHHLTLSYSDVPVERIHDPAFGVWTCAGGERAGETCEPTDKASCGAGLCRSEPKPNIGCVGYGPQAGLGIVARIVGGAMASQAYQQLRPGVFSQIPTSGIVYWNSHAFNLTDEDFVLNGRLNFVFAKEQRYPVVAINDYSNVFRPNAPPYTIESYCAKHVVDQGARLFLLTSHNHKRGKHFWATGPDGTLLYENFVYNDPVKQYFDPPLAFDSPEPAERTITFCGTWNNGVAEDGSPDPETVTRASRVPASALATIGACKPIACAAGNVGAPCAGKDDDASCDSSPGAGDGLCDACRITGGESTENEMFILIGSTYIAEGFPQPDPNDPIFGGPASAGAPLDASGRSTYTGLALPASFACTSSAADGGHSGHAMP